MNRPSRRVVEWLKENGFVQTSSGTPRYIWERQIPPHEVDRGRYPINHSNIRIVYHPPHPHALPPHREASWELTSSSHADRLMGPDEDKVLQALSEALVWQDTDRLVLWPDEERELDRDGPEGQQDARRRRGFYGFENLGMLQRNLKFEFSWVLEEEDHPPDFEDAEINAGVTALWQDGVLHAWCGAVITCFLTFRGETFPGSDSIWGLSYESREQLWKDVEKSYDLKRNARRAAIDLARKAALLSVNDPDPRAHRNRTWVRDNEALLVAIDKWLEQHPKDAS